MSMKVIEHIEVGSGGAASIEFVSVGDIPSDYTDLKIVLSARTDTANASGGGAAKIEFNTYVTSPTSRALRGQGSSGSVASFTSPQFVIVASDATSNTFGNAEITIPNYTSSNNKSLSIDSVGENNATFAEQQINAMLWSVTDAITSIKITPYGGNFVQFSSATLYGIRKYDTTGSPKATGGIISFDSVNNYWVHTFTASGTFTPTENLTAEYLVVAGGGSGGAGIGGGGGAGGYRCSVSGESSGGGASAESPLSLTASTGYTVTVGAGGAFGPPSVNGNNSVFSSITSTGGGGGGDWNAPPPGNPAKSGGSGGGAQYQGTGGAGTSNQGYAGGNGAGAPNYGTGGGGGAGAVGGTGTTSVAGNGGNGVSSSITGTAVTRAGGGGGGTLDGSGLGTGGTGGGANAGVNNGTANTGGGGGGNFGNNTGAGNGGSGIVIVRYAA